MRMHNQSRGGGSCERRRSQWSERREAMVEPASCQLFPSGGAIPRRGRLKVDATLRKQSTTLRGRAKIQTPLSGGGGRHLLRERHVGQQVCERAQWT